MSWSQVLSHDKEKKILQKAIIDNKIAHAYLLKGIDGIGKEALAIQFAKTVNCKQPLSNGIDTYDSCDKCKSCREFDNLSTSNLEIIFPLPAGKSPDAKSDAPFANLSDDIISQINDEISAKAKNHYHKISLPKANQIKISSIRHLKKKLSLSGNFSGRRCIIISEVHNITSEAANAFLKTLEEPHDKISIFLCSSRPEKVLQTITSRCQLLNISPIDTDSISQYLQTNKKIDKVTANLAAQFGQGSLTKAINSVYDDLKHDRDEIVNIFRTSIKKNFRSEISNQINKLIKDSDKSKIIQYFTLLLFWIRDGLRFSYSNSHSNFVNIDDIETITKFAKHYKDKNISNAINEIENAIYQLNSNVNTQMVLFSLFVKLRHNFIANK